MAAFLLALLAPLAVAFIGVSALWPAGRRPGPALLLKACLALGLGLGFASWAYFLWLVVAGSPGPGLIAAEAVALALLLGASVLLLRRARATPEPSASPPPETPGVRALEVVLAVVFAVVLLTRLVHLVALTVQRPHGDGDALFTWNMKARILYRSGADWRLLFRFAPPDNTKLPLAPPDYPLLLPANVARAWWYRGAESTFEPALLAVVLTAGCLLLLYATVAAVRGRAQGAIAGLALAATPWFFYLASLQIADVPLSFYLLAAVAPFVLQDAAGGTDRRWAVLAGLLAGLAGWVKNEGCLFIVVLVAVRLVLVTARSGPRAAVGEAGALLLGLLPFGVLLLYYRFDLIPSANYLLADQGVRTTLARLTDSSRYRLVLVFLFIQLFAPLLQLHVSSIGFIVLLAPLYRLLLGWAPDAARRAAATPGLVAVLMLLGYILVYLTTPLDLAPHLRMSLQRLLMHLWPLALLWFALSTASPEEALTREEGVAIVTNTEPT